MATGTLIGLGIGSLALGAAATIAGGAMNKSAQEEANATNIQLSREQMKYQTSEREAVQEYNTPANQRLRYEQAGINPYLAMSGIDSGNTQMQTGVTPAHVEPVTALGDMVQDLGKTPQQAISLVNQAQQVQAMDESVKQARIETLYKERKEIQELRLAHAKTSEALSNVSKNSAEYDSLRKQLLIQEKDLKIREIEAAHHEEYLDARNSRERSMADLTYQQTVGQFYDNESKEIVNQYLPQMNRAELSRLNAIASEAYASAREHGERSATEVTKRIMMRAQKEGILLDNESQRIANRYLDEQFKLGQESMRKHIRQQGQDYWNPFRYAGQVLGGAAAGSVAAGVRSAGPRTVVRGFVP